MSLPVFILQLIIIVVACQLSGYAFRKMGQPSVMGEIIAGLVLGPSVLGALFPAFSASVFPPASLGNLQLFSQVGLILFMFVIGMELDMGLIRSRAKSAVIISIVSIVFPFLLGAALSFFLYRHYSSAGIAFHAFALFMGIAMSITAFPVLARIIREKGIGDTRMGSIAITSAAINDVAGWCMLAVVITIVNAEGSSRLLYALAGTAAYLAVMLLLVRPLLKKILMRSDGATRQTAVVVVFLVLLASVYCAEVLGIHALFGAFLAGVIMPVEWDFRNSIINKIEDVALVLLLPVFFVLTGLRTEFGVLDDINAWMICGLITLVAVAGKLGGSAIAARIAGEDLRTSLSIGALMNTRGLMELVVLNIGYDLGILSPQIFTMMVIMALVTTLMTGPLLSAFGKRSK